MRPAVLLPAQSTSLPTGTATNFGQGGAFSGTTSGPGGTDENGTFSANWTSAIVGGPFNGQIGTYSSHWHLQYGSPGAGSGLVVRLGSGRPGGCCTSPKGSQVRLKAVIYGAQPLFSRRKRSEEKASSTRRYQKGERKLTLFLSRPHTVATLPGQRTAPPDQISSRSIIRTASRAWPWALM